MYVTATSSVFGRRPAKSRVCGDGRKVLCQEWNEWVVTWLKNS